ncbi:ArnT family glycosyltransferase [Aerosticca soli]|uniref:Glycosyltransferase RgtA/B/C/D-like domain-containing protein n=1 Tax=Aerosticca soli TaxID=2010829 RepID=A0A2Z6E5R6_9GAMM|nr:hypothetical protein [Aerosticca soli]BBD80091.1 hypothetical protein ALSL_1434 [Aerosticca soli]
MPLQHLRSSCRFWREAPLAWLAFCLMLALRLYAVWHMPVDSDEPQHLHVVWEWTQGRLPYRDFFDNHMPLFQWLCAPLLGWIGPRPEALLLMRLAQWPLTAATLLLTVHLGRRLWSVRTGLYGATLIGLLPHYYLGASIEFRPDNAWALAWLAALALVVSARDWHARRAAAIGLLAGLALAISAKSTLLIGSACLTLVLLILTAPRAWPWRRMVVAMAVGLPVMLLPAALVFGYFARHGAAGVAWYCIVQHNVVPGLGNWNGLIVRAAIFTVALCAAIVLLLRRPPADAEALRRRFLLLWPWIYLAALYSFWPLIPREHLLPAMPLVGLAFAVLSAERGDTLRFCRRVAITSVAIALFGWEISALANHAARRPSQSCAAQCDHRPRMVRQRIQLSAYQDELKTLLQITTPADTVIDAKGESIFRQRPTWLVFEGITRYRIRRGLLPDDTVAQIVAHGTPVAIDANLMPADAWFVIRHYLPIGQRLRLLGQRLPAGSQVTVDIAVPADYAAVRADGRRLWLRVDDGPAQQRFHLSAGPHRLAIVGEAGGVSALVWADALDRGLDPARLFRSAPLAMTDAAPGRPASR